MHCTSHADAVKARLPLGNRLLPPHSRPRAGRPEQTSTLQPACQLLFDDEWCCAVARCSLRMQDTSLTHRNLARISCLNAAGRQACPISSRSRKA